MLHDLSMTAAQLRAAADWCEPDMADVELRVDAAVLTVAQGDDRASFYPEGSRVEV